MSNAHNNAAHHITSTANIYRPVRCKCCGAHTEYNSFTKRLVPHDRPNSKMGCGHRRP